MTSTEERILAAASACGSLSELRRIHGFLIRNHDRIRNPSLLLAKLLRFAAVSPGGDLAYAACLCFHSLDHVPSRGRTFFYNTLMRGLARSGDPARAQALFRSMRRRGVPADQFSLTFLIKARARAEPGLGPGDLHGLALKQGCLGPAAAHVHNALIHLYAAGPEPGRAGRLFEEIPEPDAVAWTGLIRARFAAGDPAGARRALEGMPAPDVVAWTAAIDGYAKIGRPGEALALFRSMPADTPPDEVTLVAVAAACAAAGDARTGGAVERYAAARGLAWMTALRNALIGMYGRLGYVAEAERVFAGTRRRSGATWSAMVGAYAAAGEVEAALRVARGGPAGDGGTWLAALSACAHAGRVEEGRRLLGRMEREGPGPGAEHYGCVVDMLGRAGRLEEAYGLAKGLPGGIHGDVDMAERVVGEVARRRPLEGGYYLLLAGIYAAAGRHAEADEVRRRMDLTGAPKLPARSTLSL
ncbi:pentatricopeptide repeat-containing protein At5g66520-like [Wolffia australiana]